MSSNKFGAIERLTPKQAAFVSEYLKNGGNATEAYKKAGYNVTTDNSAAVNAARLLRTSKITRAIAKRQAERNERMQLEEDFELKKAIDILEKCSEPQQVYNF
ncbi:MAG: terminase small subunit, partial [Parasutterella sp.]